MTAWLDCPTTATCSECGCISWIDVDDDGCDLEDESDAGVATVRTDEETADLGQPRCTGACANPWVWRIEFREVQQ